MPMNPRLLRPLASGFNPKSLSGMLLWLDASDSSTITTDTGVSEWRDKSGLGKSMTQASGSNQPAYLTNGIGGKPALSFTAASSHFMRGTFSHTLSGVSVFITHTLGSLTANNGRSFSFTVAGQTSDFLGTDHFIPAMRDGTNQAVACRYGDAIRLPQSVTFDLPFIQCLRHDGSALLHQVNKGAAATFASSFAPAIANMMLSTFTSSGAAGAFWNGRIAEILVYNRSLSDAESGRVHAYLAAKYGITLA
jgi:hypothetical protein